MKKKLKDKAIKLINELDEGFILVINKKTGANINAVHKMSRVEEIGTFILTIDEILHEKGEFIVGG